MFNINIKGGLPMKQLYPECSECQTERIGIGPDVCESAQCPGKRNECYRKQIEELNKYCIGCPDNGRNFDRCNYHCSVGFKIHKLDCLMGNGDHSRW